MSLVTGIAEQSIPVTREQVLPYLGAYDHHTWLDFIEQGFVLQTHFGALPLAAYADSGCVNGGAL